MSKRHRIQIPESSRERLIREQQGIGYNEGWYKRIVRPMNFEGDYEEDMDDLDRDWDEDRSY